MKKKELQNKKAQKKEPSQTPPNLTFDNHIFFEATNSYTHVLPADQSIINQDLEIKIESNKRFKEVLKLKLKELEKNPLIKFFDISKFGDIEKYREKIHSESVEYKKNVFRHLINPEIISISSNSISSIPPVEQDRRDFNIYIDQIYLQKEGIITDAFARIYIISKIAHNLLLLGVNPLLLILNRYTRITFSTLEMETLIGLFHNEYYKFYNTYLLQTDQGTHDLIYKTPDIIKVLTSDSIIAQKDLLDLMESTIIFNKKITFKYTLEKLLKMDPNSITLFNEEIIRIITLAIIRGNYDSTLLLIHPDLWKQYPIIDQMNILKLIATRAGDTAKIILVEFLLKHNLLTPTFIQETINSALSEEDKDLILEKLSPFFNKIIAQTFEHDNSKEKSQALKLIILNTEEEVSKKVIQILHEQKLLDSPLFTNTLLSTDITVETAQIFQAFEPFFADIIVKSSQIKTMDSFNELVDILLPVLSISEEEYATNLINKLAEKNILNADLYINLLNINSRDEERIAKLFAPFYKDFLLKMLDNHHKREDIRYLVFSTLSKTLHYLEPSEKKAFLTEHKGMIKDFLNRHQFTEEYKTKDNPAIGEAFFIALRETPDAKKKKKKKSKKKKTALIDNDSSSDEETIEAQVNSDKPGGDDNNSPVATSEAESAVTPVTIELQVIAEEIVIAPALNQTTSVERNHTETDIKESVNSSTESSTLSDITPPQSCAAPYLAPAQAYQSIQYITPAQALQMQAIAQHNYAVLQQQLAYQQYYQQYALQHTIYQQQTQEPTFRKTVNTITELETGKTFLVEMIENLVTGEIKQTFRDPITNQEIKPPANIKIIDAPSASSNANSHSNTAPQNNLSHEPTSQKIDLGAFKTKDPKELSFSITRLENIKPKLEEKETYEEAIEEITKRGEDQINLPLKEIAEQKHNDSLTLDLHNSFLKPYISLEDFDPIKLPNVIMNEPLFGVDFKAM
jgi:hypothetical protein